jgi:hypothetical protein
MKHYQATIAKLATFLELELDPRHVHAWMRSDHGTLNHLPRYVFADYCYKVADADEAWTIQLEAMAQIEGL